MILLRDSYLCTFINEHVPKVLPSTYKLMMKSLMIFFKETTFKTIFKKLKIKKIETV